MKFSYQRNLTGVVMGDQSMMSCVPLNQSALEVSTGLRVGLNGVMTWWEEKPTVMDFRWLISLLRYQQDTHVGQQLALSCSPLLPDSLIFTADHGNFAGYLPFCDWKGICNKCGKVVQVPKRLFCRNFGGSQGPFPACQKVRCGKCYRMSTTLKLPQVVPINNEGRMADSSCQDDKHLLGYVRRKRPLGGNRLRQYTPLPSKRHMASRGPCQISGGFTNCESFPGTGSIFNKQSNL
eukprot:10682228-Ditylum_brightwellii.AAC.1